jgi:hypothetical protein
MTQFCAPQNVSLLNPNEFRFFLHRAPYLTFFAQTVALPTIDMGDAVPTSTPFTDVHTPGDHIEFEDLSVTFLVDEDLKGYLEMYHWIRGLGFPTTFDEYKEAVANERVTNRWQETTSDISVFTFSGSRNANIEWHFVNAFPVMVSAPTVSTTNPDQPVVTAKVRFKYTYFDVKPVKTP